MYDIETMGKNTQTCPILSIASYEFDTDRFLTNPYTLEEIVMGSSYVKFDLTSQVTRHGCIVEKDTLEWWKTQGGVAWTSQVEPSSQDAQIEALQPFFEHNYKDQDVPVFTRGNTFDPVIISAWFKRFDAEEPYKWWNIRDMRSMIEGLSYGADVRNTFMPRGINERDIIKHDPRYDVALDILRYQALVQAIS